MIRRGRSTSLTSPAELRHEHACLLSSGREASLAEAAAFIRAGLERGERCMFILSESSLVEVVDALDRCGIDVPARAADGALMIVRAQQLYLRTRPFRPEAVIELVTLAIAEARRAGYAGLRAAGEMGWASSRDVGPDALLRYERGLNETVFRGGRVTGLCLFDTDVVGDDLARDLAEAHPIVFGARPRGRTASTQRGGLRAH